MKRIHIFHGKNMVGLGFLKKLSSIGQIGVVCLKMNVFSESQCTKLCKLREVQFLSNSVENFGIPARQRLDLATGVGHYLMRRPVVIDRHRQLPPTKVSISEA